jgi:hypothetical protein
MRSSTRLILSSLQRLFSSKGIDGVVRQLRHVGLTAITDESKKKIIVSYNRQTSPPYDNWRDMANCILTVTPSTTPAPGVTGATSVTSVASELTVRAWGPSELYYPSTAMIGELLKKNSLNYLISPVIYGTILWFYNVGDEWRMATKRILDGRKETIRGICLYDIVSKLIDPSSFPSTEICYGFLIHDCDLHLLHYNKTMRGLWLVSMKNRENDNLLGNPSFDHLRPKLRTGENVAEQPSIIWTKKVFTDFCQASPESIVKAVATYESESPPERFLGVILRRIGEGQRTHPNDWIIKSPLHTFLDLQVGDGSDLRKLAARSLGAPADQIKLLSILFPTFTVVKASRDKAIDTLCQTLIQIHSLDPIPEALQGMKTLADKLFELGCRGNDKSTQLMMESILSRPNFELREQSMELIVSFMTQ